MGEYKIDGMLMTNAVFLDRDGVLIELVPNPKTGEAETAKSVSDIKFYPGVFESLKSLSDAGYQLFLVSNQPDYAKGKATMEDLKRVHKEFDRELASNGIHFTEYYYCYHHPNGVVPGYSYQCECRKPRAFFILEAARNYKVDLSGSWMIGDRDIDIECGKTAGTKTVLIDEPRSADRRGKSNPDFEAKSLKEAVERFILR